MVDLNNSISVFLASSNELKQERIEFGNFIRQLSDIFEKRGLCIKLKKWEDVDAAYNGCRKQDDYNVYVRNSNIFLALFYTKAGKYTIEEFDVALEEYKRTGVKPKIYVFCKDLKNGEQESDSLKNFKSRLDNNLGFYWSRYYNSDSLHLSFVMQLLLYENKLVDNLKIENGELMIDGFHVARMDKLSFVTNNKDFQQINRRLKELSILIETNRLQVDKHPDNKDLQYDLQGQIDEKNELQDKLVQQQNLLFETAKRINSIQVSAITERMRKAIDAFESGDIHEANIFLDETEFNADRNLANYLQSTALADRDREKAILSIEELLLKASVYLSDVSVNIEKRVDTVRNLYIKADEIAQKVGYEKEKHAKLLIDFVNFSLKYGHYNDAMNYGKCQIQLSKELYGDSSIKIASIYNLMGLVYCEMGDFSKALEYHLKTLSIEETELGSNNVYTATSYNNIGLAYHHMGDYSRALEYYKKAMIVREEILGKDSLETATTYNNVGGLYKILGDYSTALDYYSKAKEIHEKILGSNHLNTAKIYHSIGSLYEDIGKYAKAKEYLLKAIAIKEKELGPKHPETAYSYNNIGEVYRELRDYLTARKYYTLAYEAFQKTLGIHYTIANILNNIGLTFYEQDDCDNALLFYDKAKTIYKNTLGKEHIDVANNLHNIGMAYLKQGDCENALTYLNNAKKIFISKLGPNHPNSQKTQKWIDYATSKH